MNKKNSLTINGVVTKASDQTAKIRVTLTKRDSLYQKNYTVHKNYLAHIPENKQLEIGDEVIIERCRPLSKNKRWVVKG